MTHFEFLEFPAQQHTSNSTKHIQNQLPNDITVKACDLFNIASVSSHFCQFSEHFLRQTLLLFAFCTFVCAFPFCASSAAPAQLADKISAQPRNRKKVPGRTANSDKL
jgi:hypothetical protein